VWKNIGCVDWPIRCSKRSFTPKINPTNPSDLQERNFVMESCHAILYMVKYCGSPLTLILFGICIILSHFISKNPNAAVKKSSFCYTQTYDSCKFYICMSIALAWFVIVKYQGLWNHWTPQACNNSSKRRNNHQFISNWAWAASTPNLANWKKRQVHYY